MKFEYPNFDINFRLNFDTDSEPNDGEIMIFNLSSNSISKIKKGQSIILNAGYEGDVGTIAMAVITDIRGYWEGVNKVLKLSIGDATDRWANSTVNRSYKPGIKASQMLRDLLGMFGLEVSEMTLPIDVLYVNGRTVSGALQSIVKQIVNDCGAKFHISNGRVFIRPPGKGTQTGFLLASDTGLIDSPRHIDSDDGRKWGLFSLLNHRIAADSLIRIESKAVVGNFRVVKGVHVSNEGDHSTYMEVANL